jgi:hypothetical protein
MSTTCPPIKLLTLNPGHSLFISVLKKYKQRFLAAAILLLVQGLTSDGANTNPTSIVRPVRPAVISDRRKLKERM